MPATPVVEALESFHAAFREKQARRRALLVRAARLRESGRDPDAEEVYRELLRHDDRCASAWAALSDLFLAGTRFQEALGAAARCLDIDPLQAGAHVTFGHLLRDSPVAADALQTYRRLARADNLAASGDVYVRIGNTQLARLDVDGAIDNFTKAVETPPGSAAACRALSIAFHCKGDRDRSVLWSGFAALADEEHEAAIEALSSLLGTSFATPDVYVAVGDCYSALTRYEDAARAYERGCERWPESATLCLRAVGALQTTGQIAAAMRLARRGVRNCPASVALRRARYLTLPIVYASEAQIRRYRNRFASGLKRLAAETRLDTVDQRREALRAAGPNFYLAYQGRDDKALQVEYGAWVAQITRASFPAEAKAPAVHPARTDDRLRVGYVSGYLNRHTVADLFFGWVRHADRDRFNIHCYHLGRRRDIVSDEFRAHADQFHHLPDDIETVRRQIAADRLDVLTYFDIGMFSAATRLASLRLAPVQCAAWGHPVTTGLPTIDWFISVDLMEPPGGEHHYSEALVRLPNIGISVAKSLPPRHPTSRASLGIDDDAVVFLCCQSPFKYLPQYDRVLVDIARRVPHARFVFIEQPGARPLENRLTQAFGAAGIDSTRTLVFLPPQSQSAFLGLMTVSDVYLDTIAWSGGHTTLEAIAMGLPVVTFPSGLMRGRHSAAMLTVLGVTETIARSENEYVEMAAALGRDRLRRADVSAHMTANDAKLFDDVRCVRALEDFYRTVGTHCEAT